jgi:hypothetical protein
MEAELIKLWREDIQKHNEIVNSGLTLKTIIADGELFEEDHSLVPIIKKWAPMLDGLKTNSLVVACATALQETEFMINHLVFQDQDDNYRTRMRRRYIPVVRRIVGDLQDQDIDLNIDYDIRINQMIPSHRHRLEGVAMNMIDLEEEFMDRLTLDIVAGLKQRGSYNGKLFFRLDDQENVYI